MANKLTIEAELNADGVTKGIDDIDGKLQKLEKAATGTADKGAKSTEKWADALKDLGDSVPSGAEAAGLEKVADATSNAGEAAQVAQGAFARFGQSLRGFGGAVGGAIRSAFSGLGSMLAGLGRALGTAFMFAFRAALIAVPVAGVLVAALGVALKDMHSFAEAEGKKWMKTFTDAFNAGLDMGTFTRFKAEVAGIFTEADATGFAKSMGTLQETMRRGGEEAAKVDEIIKRLGGNLADLGEGGGGFLKLARDIATEFNKLDELQQKKVLENLIPGGTDEQFAALKILLADVTKNYGALNQAAMSAITQSAGALQQQKAMGDAAKNAKTGFMSLVGALDEITGASDKYRGAINLIPGALNIAAIAFQGMANWVRGLPAAFDSVGQSISDFTTKVSQVGNAVGTAILDTFKKAVTIVSDLGGAFGALAGVAWTGIKAGIDAIATALGGIVSQAQSAIDKLRELFKEQPNPGRDIGGMFRPQAAPLQATPFVQPFSAGLMRTMAAPTAATLGGAGILATTLAANDNGGLAGGYSSGEWDQLLFNYKQLTAERKKAADAAIKETAANRQAAESLVAANTALGGMLSNLGITKTQLQEWVTSTALAKTETDEWADAQLRLKAALEAGMITSAQYGAAFERLKTQLDTSPMQTAINDLRQGFASFADSASASLADAIVNGENLGEVLGNLAKQLASMILQALVLKPLMNALFGGLGGGASGGGLLSGITGGAGLAAASSAPMAGLMRASTMQSDLSGLSNFAGRMGASAATPTQQITQNVKTDIKVDTGSGQTRVTSNQGIAFAKQLDAAVQQILVREQRPGGSLYQRSAA